MEHRLPTSEELIDLAWLLDSALYVGDRAWAMDSGTRLLDSLRRLQEGLAGSYPDGGPTTAAFRHAWLKVSADVAATLTVVESGKPPRAVQFRHRIEALASGQEPAAA